MKESRARSETRQIVRLLRFVWIGLFLLAMPFACAQTAGPNDSFEHGRRGNPTGWTLSGGVGEWEKEGHSGKRCISVTGDGKSSNYWSQPVKLAGAYRIEFWTKSSPDATGGNIVAGTNLCSVDFRHTTEWTRRSIVFKHSFTQRSLRLGQWQVKGKVYFD
ncbi:hypothetical protein FJY63_00300, partial [Candidatus Sumerlaeota bacterium]|nr:hypothetical protein [Candidatus Sumerlaeota bacterium]